MKPEMRQRLARESYAEKIRKAGSLIRLAKTFPRRQPTSKSVQELLTMAKKLGCGVHHIVTICQYEGLTPPTACASQ